MRHCKLKVLCNLYDLLWHILFKKYYKKKKRMSYLHFYLFLKNYLNFHLQNATVKSKLRKLTDLSHMYLRRIPIMMVFTPVMNYAKSIVGMKAMIKKLIRRDLYWNCTLCQCLQWYKHTFISSQNVDYGHYFLTSSGPIRAVNFKRKQPSSDLKISV